MTRSDPCEYSQFCATWGFCEECDQQLYRAMILAEAAMREAGVPANSERAVPYVQILHTLRVATGRPIPQEAEPQPAPFTGLRGLLEHVGIDVAGRVITVDGIPIDDVGQPQRATVPGVEACYSGRFCVSWGFCHRCAPKLTEEAGRRFKETDGSSEAYAAIVKGLTEPTTKETQS